MLRIIVVLFGVGLIVGGFLMLAQGSDARSAAAAFFVMGALLVGGTIFEARRYRPSAAPGARYEDTGERFIDPTTGKLTEVRYDPATGKREYVDNA
jgi:hypothetical protein